MVNSSYLDYFHPTLNISPNYIWIFNIYKRKEYVGNEIRRENTWITLEEEEVNKYEGYEWWINRCIGYEIEE